MRTSELEKRLAAVEREVADLKAVRESAASTHPIHALQQLHGTFENDSAFREAMRLGRKWRNSQGETQKRKGSAE